MNDIVQGITELKTAVTNPAAPLPVELKVKVPAGDQVIGKVGIDQTTPGTTNKVTVSAEAASGATAPTNTVQVGGKDATGKIYALLTDTDGHLQTDVLTGGGAGGGEQYVDGTDVDAGYKGTIIAGTDGTHYQFVATDDQGNVQTDIVGEVPAGTQIIGKVGIDQTTDGTTNRVVAKISQTTGENLVGAGDGDIVSIGAKADAAVVDPTLSGSEIAFLKGLLKQLQGGGTGQLPVSETYPITQKMGDQLLCIATGLTVPQDGGTAKSYAVDLAFYTRKTALIAVTGAPVTAALKAGNTNNQTDDEYTPVTVGAEDCSWPLAIGKHAVAIPEDLQATYLWFKFTNDDTETDAVIKGMWQAKGV